MKSHADAALGHKTLSNQAHGMALQVLHRKIAALPGLAQGGIADEQKRVILRELSAALGLTEVGYDFENPIASHEEMERKLKGESTLEILKHRLKSSLIDDPRFLNVQPEKGAGFLKSELQKCLDTANSISTGMIEAAARTDQIRQPASSRAA